MNQIARTHFSEDGTTMSRMHDIVIMDDEDAARADNADYREAAARQLEFNRRRDMFICGGKTSEDRLMRYDATLLALGRCFVREHKSAASLARSHRVTSARITTLVRTFQDYMKLPPMNGQNTDEQRENKSQSRTKGLK